MTKHHIRDLFPRHSGAAAARLPQQPMPLTREQVAQEQADDERSLDLVQRVVTSALAIVVGGGISILLALNTVLGYASADQASRVGLWVMAGIAGILTTAAVLIINRRHPYSPLLLLGLLPMAISAYWLWAG